MSTPLMQIALPQFAPLPTPFVLHLLNLTVDGFLHRLYHSYDELQAILQQLEHKVVVSREYVVDSMTPVLEKRQRATLWFQESLRYHVNRKHTSRDESSKIYSVSGRTLATWQNNHVLLPSKPEHQFLDRAAAILISSIIDDRKQGYTPSSLSLQEPYYWVYSQYDPDAPVLPCPIPLPPNLPIGTLLWSLWPTLDPSWLSFGQWGSMRFSSLDRASLARWEPSLNNPNMSLLFEDQGFFGRMKPEALQNYASQVLFKCAPNLLSPSSPRPHIPLVVSPNNSL